MLHIKEQRDRAKARGMADPEAGAGSPLTAERAAAVESAGREYTPRRRAIPHAQGRARRGLPPCRVAHLPPASVYSDWTSPGAAVLAAADSLRSAEDGRYLDSEQRRRATLLVAMYACVRYDAARAIAAPARHPVLAHRGAAGPRQPCTD